MTNQCIPAIIDIRIAGTTGINPSRFLHTWCIEIHMGWEKGAQGAKPYEKVGETGRGSRVHNEYEKEQAVTSAPGPNTAPRKNGGSTPVTFMNR